MPIKAEIAQKELHVLAALGDGNCALRSIIQSLLAQGMLHDKKEWVAHFIQELVNRNEGKVKEVYHLNKPATLHSFIEQYKMLTIDQLDTFSQDFFINKEANTPTAPILSQEEHNRLYLLLEKNNATLSSSEASELEKLYLKLSSSQTTNKPKDDSVLYFLNACLRQDIISFNNENLNLETISASDDAEIQQLIKSEQEDHLKSLQTLGAFVDIRHITPYLKHHNIGVQIYTNKGELQAHASTRIAAENRNEVDIHLILHSQHYNVLLPAKELQIKQDETIAKKLQIEEDKTLGKKPQTDVSEKELQIKQGEVAAKQLQMEEIKDFAERFKSSGNKDNLSFIRDVINGLGLERELNLEQLSHLRTLDLDKLVGELQLVIKDLGYSSEFKEKIQHYSFFSPPCRQEIVDTDQTLTSTPAIKCN
ncbi:hypothetical protein [Candidatus Rickettsiella viridis]|nr:hypothetical protein [Candidatus Rickettsiella viridis]